jgi:sugar/nucleoside kinase (ribokinase family)
MGRILKPSKKTRYNLLVGVGGIGTGMFFKLEGDHTLGRNESRPAALLDVRDYCKLHIIAHYVAVLLGAKPSGKPFHALPIGKVGDDVQGHRLIEEMRTAGMDTRLVDIVTGKPTMLSICFQYPDGSGGNITTSISAASDLSNADIDCAAKFLGKSGSRGIVLAAPEVPLGQRKHLLELATKYHAFRTASFTSAEMKEAYSLGMFSMIDLLAVNEDEAGALVGREFNTDKPDSFLESCASVLVRANPDMRIVLSAGKHGAYGFENGRWGFCPAAKVDVASTAGAGDALLGGTIAALAAGLPLIASGSRRKAFTDMPVSCALDFAVLLAGFKVTSPHTIHPDANLTALISFARKLRIGFSPEVLKCFS